MGWQPTQAAPPKITKAKKIDGNVVNADVVIVYGDVKGNITNADTVVIINGDVYGNISNCDNVAGFLADQCIPVNRIVEVQTQPGVYEKLRRWKGKDEEK